MISKRLLSLVKYIHPKDRVIDVGCDHALLDIYLVKNNYLNSIIVSDVHKFALDSGIENIKKEGLQNKILARLGDGLEVLKSDDNIDTLLISGMGTNTILKILSSKHTNNINKLIIQSNNDHYLLRKSICNLGFKIFDEECIYDNEKYYVNIIFIRGKKNYSLNDLKYGPILKNTGKAYYKYLKDKIYKIYNNIPEESHDKLLLKDKLKELDEIIDI